MAQRNADLRSLRGYSLTLAREFGSGRGGRWVLLRSTQPTNCGIYYKISIGSRDQEIAPTRLQLLMLWIWQSRPSRQGGAARRGKCRNRVLRKQLGFSANGSTTN